MKNARVVAAPTTWPLGTRPPKAPEPLVCVDCSSPKGNSGPRSRGWRGAGRTLTGFFGSCSLDRADDRSACSSASARAAAFVELGGDVHVVARGGGGVAVLRGACAASGAGTAVVCVPSGRSTREVWAGRRPLTPAHLPPRVRRRRSAAKAPSARPVVSAVQPRPQPTPPSGAEASGPRASATTATDPLAAPEPRKR